MAGARSASVLNVRSAQPAVAEERTAKARIRDAALACFAADGVARTSVRAIAAAAGVSPGLVIHHYGSKDALRSACDQYLVAEVRRVDDAALALGPSVDPVGILRELGEGRDLVRYLARTLADGSPHVAELVEDLVANGVAVSREAERVGAVHPCDDEHARAVVLTLWSLGALVLHEYLERLLGEDVLGDLPASSRYLATAVDLLGRPVLTEATYRQWRDALAATTVDPSDRESREGP